MKNKTYQRLELNGGRIFQVERGHQFYLPAVSSGYADAQLHDYGRLPPRRPTFPYLPGTRLSLNARFSHSAKMLKGTAGFGFWNAPFGDPTLKRPSLPQAAWFFFASAPGELPFAAEGQGRGWFVATLDATTVQAFLLAPFAPLVLLLNQIAVVRRRLWPRVQRGLSISYAPLNVDMEAWQQYELVWQPAGCQFAVNGKTVLDTPHSPRGPLGFVCWIDNQYMVATASGRFGWGTLKTSEPQWMETADLHIN